MVKFTVQERVNPQALLDPRKYYAFVKSQGAVNLRQIARRFSRESTISIMDTLALLEGLLQVIPDLLADGKIVRLGEFGTFRVTISSDGVETADDFNINAIKGVNLVFVPGVEFRDRLNDIKFSKVNGN